MPEDIKFSGIYYKDILKALQRYRRENIPELNDFNPYSIESQLERVMALALHTANVNLDIFAQEMLPSTAKLTQSLLNWANSIGYPVDFYTPAVVDVVGKLVSNITTPTICVPKGYKFSGVTKNNSVPFETINDFVVTNTNTYNIRYWSVRLNKYLQNRSIFTSVGDRIFIGFETMPTKVSIETDSLLSNCITSVKYFDGGSYLWKEVTFKNGTSYPSFNSLKQTIAFELPQDLDKNWTKIILDNIQGYFLMITFEQVDTNEVLPQVTNVIANDFYVKFPVYQGTTITEEFVSDGTPNQVFPLSSPGLIDKSIDSILVVEGSATKEWVRVHSLVDSKDTDRVYMVKVSNGGESFHLIFGDNNNGKVPSNGSIIKATYRSLAVGDDGLVDEKTLSGSTDRVISMSNPRKSFGGVKRLYDTETLRNNVITWLKMQDRLLTAEDIKSYILKKYSVFIDRVNVIEDKDNNQIFLVVVGKGGSYCDQSVLQQIEAFLNDKDTSPLVINQKVVVINYTKVQFNIDVTITTTGSINDISTLLQSVFNPLSKSDDGGWLWDFNSIILKSFIYSCLYKNSSIKSVTINQPQTDIPCGLYGLPYIDSSNIFIRASFV